MLDVIRSLRRDSVERDDVWKLAQACRQLLSERGESNSRSIASAALERWRRLDADGVHRFFKVLASDFDPDPGEVLRLAENYAVSRSPDNLVRLAKAAEPPRQELLRRLNRAEGGTHEIVRMRQRLLDRRRQDRSLKAV
ncbi:MAG: malonyl-CoA decarboxylase N-terminal domain-containing protein, partial [Burkholderiales bacterium]|nr:malonyl-CoA decarboxylase N-terminal domain-containing protein [Burkholderiales bacterium]